MKNDFRTTLRILLACTILSASAEAQIGGQFAITQSVIAGGGADSSGGNFRVTGTTAQAVAGTTSTNGDFGLTGGFWQTFLAPTAANASVSGRVTTAASGGIPNARVSLISQTGAAQTVLTNSFGYFNFSEVLAGETYFITVRSKLYRFANPTQVVFVADEISDLIFIADWEH